MALERIIIKRKRKKAELARDKIFYSLAKIMIDDYFKIQQEYEDYIPYEVGKEFTTHLHGALILLEPNEREIKNYCRKINYFNPIGMNEEDFITKLKTNLEDDGARIIKDNKLVLKAGVYAHHQAEKKEGEEITEIIKKYTIPSIKFVGERITAALAFSIATKKHTYIISQTIQPTQTDVFIEGNRYSKIGTGKVAEFGPKGLIRMVKLESFDKSIPANHLLDDRVYVKQYNYSFDECISLYSKNYLILEDLNSLTDS